MKLLDLTCRMVCRTAAATVAIFVDVGLAPCARGDDIRVELRSGIAGGLHVSKSARARIDHDKQLIARDEHVAGR